MVVAPEAALKEPPVPAVSAGARRVVTRKARTTVERGDLLLASVLLTEV